MFIKTLGGFKVELWETVTLPSGTYRAKVFQYDFKKSVTRYEIMQKFFYSYSYRYYWRQFIEFEKQYLKLDDQGDAVPPHGFWYHHSEEHLILGQMYQVSMDVKTNHPQSIGIRSEDLHSGVVSFCEIPEGELLHVKNLALTEESILESLMLTDEDGNEVDWDEIDGWEPDLSGWGDTHHKEV